MLLHDQVPDSLQLLRPQPWIRFFLENKIRRKLVFQTKTISESLQHHKDGSTLWIDQSEHTELSTSESFTKSFSGPRKFFFLVLTIQLITFRNSEITIGRLRSKQRSPIEITNHHMPLFERIEKPRSESSLYRKAHRPMSNRTNLYTKGLRDLRTTQRQEDLQNLSINASAFKSLTDELWT